MDLATIRQHWDSADTPRDGASTPSTMRTMVGDDTVPPLRPEDKMTHEPWSRSNRQDSSTPDPLQIVHGKEAHHTRKTSSTTGVNANGKPGHARGNSVRQNERGRVDSAVLPYDINTAHTAQPAPFEWRTRDYGDLPEVVSAPEVVKHRPSEAPVMGYVQPARMSMDNSISIPDNAPATVTPIALLGDQPDWIDCPFCLRRCETRVNKTASKYTHGWAAACFASTGIGVCLPYTLDWNTHLEHYCSNCNRRVFLRRYRAKEPQVFGTPSHKRVNSQCPIAECRPQTAPAQTWRSPTMRSPTMRSPTAPSPTMQSPSMRPQTSRSQSVKQHTRGLWSRSERGSDDAPAMVTQPEAAMAAPRSHFSP